MTKQYFLEWSEAQGHFHIDEADRLVEKNLKMILAGKFPVYVPIYQGSLEDCSRMADKLEHFRGIKINDRKRAIYTLAEAQNKGNEH